MTLGLASPACGLMHDNSARANTQANHSRWHAHKCLTNNAKCACHRERVGGDFERTEGKRESNRLTSGPGRAHPWHTQDGREHGVSCGKQKWKRPTEKGWASNTGGVVAIVSKLSLVTHSRMCASRMVQAHASRATAMGWASIRFPIAIEPPTTLPGLMTAATPTRVSHH